MANTGSQRTTFRAVNAAIKAAGGQEVLVAGNGYYYFSEGDAASWRESGVYGVSRLSAMSVEQWLDVWKRKKVENS